MDTIVLDLIGTTEVLDRVPNLTYRQLDYWARTQLLDARDVTGEPWPWSSLAGSGHQRMFPIRELAVIEHLAALVNVGFDPGVAIDLARAFADGEGIITVGHGSHGRRYCLSVYR